MANEAELVYIVLEVVIAVACCLGNVLVIWALWLCGAIRRQPTFCFIASLAVADFLVGAVGIPVAILVDGHVPATFHGCVALCSVVIVLTQASMHSLLAIALDRFLRVYIPLRYKTLVTDFRAWCVVIVCWIGAFLLGSVPLLGWTNPQSPTDYISSYIISFSSSSSSSSPFLSNSFNSTTTSFFTASTPTTSVSSTSRIMSSSSSSSSSASSSSPSSLPMCQFMVVMSMSYMVFFNFLSCSLVPMLCTSVLYAYIFWRISRQLHSRDVVSKHYYRRERSLACSLALVLVLFAICWLPMRFVNVAVYSELQVPRGVIYLAILLSHANSAVNPVVYTFKVPRIQKAYVQIWRSCVVWWSCGGDNKPEQSGSSSDNTDNALASSGMVKRDMYPNTESSNSRLAD